jgi:hypothetical protein
LQLQLQLQFELELRRDASLVKTAIGVRPSDAPTGRLGYLLDHKSNFALGHRAIPARSQRDVGLGDDPEAFPGVVYDWNASHLELGHLLLDVPQVVVRPASGRHWRHQVVEFRAGILSCRNGTHRKITISHDAHDFPGIVYYRNAPAVAITHHLRGTPRGIVAAKTIGIPRHDFLCSHRSAPS